MERANHGSGRVVLATVLAVALAASAGAAERCVLAEEFTATWCGPCENAGQAMSLLLDNYPDQLVAIQIHQADGYTYPWGNTRATFYGVPGYPTTWFDGVDDHVGSYSTVQLTYNDLLAGLNDRLAVASDVTVEAGAELLSPQVYRVRARVGVEAGGATRDLRIHIVQVLDYYPAGIRHRDCFMNAANSTQDVILDPGETVVVTRNIVVDSASWADQPNIRFIVWAQKQGASAPKRVYNAAENSYPFSPLVNYRPGDANGDGHVDNYDLQAVLDGWSLCNGNANFNPSADFDGTGCISNGDLQEVLDHWGE